MNVCIETHLNPLVHDHTISVAVLQTERQLYSEVGHQVIRIATFQLQITGSHHTLNSHDGRVMRFDSYINYKLHSISGSLI